MLRRRSGLSATLLAATLAGGGCDSSAPIAPSPLAGGTVAVIVSDPVSPAPTGTAGATLEGRIAANGASNGLVAYVAMEPGSVPGGTSAGITSPRLADIIQATMVDGGLDPVAVPAVAGDTLEISFRLSSGGIVSARAAVPARRRPRVVRTQPTRGRRDVAINSVVTAIFSEPLDPATLGDSTVRLLRDGFAVAGRVQPAAWSTLAVEFVPAAPLAPGTVYQLALDERIRDLSGEPLELPEAVEFTTSSGTGTGTLVVTVRTAGTDLDSDGYYPRINGVSGDAIGINDSLVLTGIPTGSHAIILDGTSSNCVSAGGIFRTATVAAGATARVSFELTCYRLPVLTILVTTTGSDLDTDGYDVRIDGDLIGTVASNGSLAISGRPISATQVALDGMRGNCFAPEQLLPMPPGADATLRFDVVCTADFTPSGVIAYARRGWPGVIFVANADGSGAVAITTTNGSTWDRSPAWSPDGSRIAFVREGWNGSEIFVANADGSNVVLRASGGFSNESPTWSPDGTRIAFSSDRSGQYLIYVTEVDGDWQSPVQIGYSWGWNVQPAWSPAGETIAFVSDVEGGDLSLHVVDADGSNPRRVDLGLGRVSEASWLPDGRISVTRSPDYRWPPSLLEVIAPDGSRRSSHPGTWPSPIAWAPDGVTLAQESCQAGVSCGIRFMRLDGQRSSVVIPDGFDAAWRP